MNGILCLPVSQPQWNYVLGCVFSATMAHHDSKLKTETEQQNWKGQRGGWKFQTLLTMPTPATRVWASGSVFLTFPVSSWFFRPIDSATHKTVHNKIKRKTHTLWMCVWHTPYWRRDTAKQKNAVKVIRATPASDFIAGTWRELLSKGE